MLRLLSLIFGICLIVVGFATGSTLLIVIGFILAAFGGLWLIIINIADIGFDFNPFD